MIINNLKIKSLLTSLKEPPTTRNRYRAYTGIQMIDEIDKVQPNFKAHGGYLYVRL